MQLRASLREGRLAIDDDESARITRSLRRAQRLVRGSTLMDARVRALRLYHRFLQRDPESPDVVTYWAGHLDTDGYARVSDEFAESHEAQLRFVRPLDSMVTGEEAQP